MAIFSLHHSVIGKATQARPDTAAAHIRYITRRRACSTILAARLPAAPTAAAQWFSTQEVQDRKNARICDKLMLALPRELDAAQRLTLVRDYAEQLTRQRASWIAAIHDMGKDAQNPHCHLVLRDRDIHTGKRVMLTTERGSTERFRSAWETCCNAHLERARQTVRVSRLSLRAQGITRTATLHEGVRARQLAAKRQVGRSRPVNARNAVTARTRSRQINYPVLDGGRSRISHNEAVRAANERAYWAAIDADARQRAAAQPVPQKTPAVTAPAPMHNQVAAWLQQRGSPPLPSPPSQGRAAVHRDVDAWLKRQQARGTERGYSIADDD